MLGAVVGDIIGSCYESKNTKDYNFNILSSRSKFTDDSVMTLAVAKWLTVDDSHDENELIECMCDLGRKYPHRGYGGAFRRWLVQDDPVPYNSWGNGSAMRVSPAGLYARTLDEALELAKISAEVTLSHPVLGKRLREITEVVAALSGDIDSIMGAGIDAKKLKSSMTLFDAVSPDDIFGEVLSKFFGGRRSNRTLKMLGL